FGHAFIPPSTVHERSSFLGSLLAWDGGWYTGIVKRGYRHCVEGIDGAGFFPAYPLLASIVVRITHVSAELALVLTAHLCLVLAMILFYAYVRGRAGGHPHVAEL